MDLRDEQMKRVSGTDATRLVPNTDCVSWIEQVRKSV
jgi:hypothetical protein